MGLTKDVQIDTEKSGADTKNVYFRIPRTDDLGFHSWLNKKHITFNVEMWSSYEARLEEGVKKPLRVINVRIVSGTLEEVIEARKGLGKDDYMCSFDEVINKPLLKTYILEDVSGDDFDVIEARAVVRQFYDYVKTVETDFCGIDMTDAQDHP